jgi:hypothetical protein
MKISATTDKRKKADRLASCVTELGRRQILIHEDPSGNVDELFQPAG